MEPQDIVTTARDALGARRVFGDPIDANGTTVIPVAIVGGGVGGGSRAGQGQGGVGFGLTARAAGVFVVHYGDARWRPAVDVNRIVLGGQILPSVAIITLGPPLLGWLLSGSRRERGGERMLKR